MRNLVSLLLASASLMAPMAVEASVNTILPKPKSLELMDGGSFILSGAVKLTDPTDCQLLKEFLTSNGCEIGNQGREVTVTLVDKFDTAFDHQLAGYDNEAYAICIDMAEVTIKAVTPTGVIRATQTLAQLAEDSGGSLESCNIIDWPAFKLRGFMHDVGRSFISVDALINQIEKLSQFKVNTFHWHLTENQAWRFEVKAYPQLTAASSMTRFAGQYYTQDDCRRVMEAAKKHGVTVIPEIDMPGHSEAFERAMGFAMQTTQGKEVLLKVLEEVAEVFADAPYIHIGADEKAITDGTFLKTMTDKIHSLGKKAVCWNPISGVTITSATGFDMTQMWSTAGKKIAGIPNIDCRYNYTNHFDVFADLVGIFKSSIYYVEQGTPEVAGTISCPWNDRKTPTETDIIRQNNVYANTLASAERAWTGGGKQYIEVGGTTLPNSGEEFDEFADWERRFLFHKAHSLKDEAIPYVKQTNVRWMITDPFPNGGNSATVFPPETEELAGEFTYNGKTYGASMATGAAVYLRHTWGQTIPTFYGTDYGTGNTAYAYTYIYSPVAQTAGALIEFQNYGRSEKDTAPDAGKWDRKGSRIWLNDQEILPDSWTNSGKTITNEVDLGNENFTARAPKQIELKEGWNKVLIKLPYVAASGVRLNKWLFTFVVTDTEGVNALDGLIYSPTRSLNADEEAISALILEVKSWLRREFADEVGYYAHTAESLALVEMIEKAEGGDIDNAATFLDNLAKAYESLKANYKSGGINQPKPGLYYYLHTPLRDSRYLTAGAAGAGVTGAAATSKSAGWRFDSRADGSFNMVNCATGAYLAPTAANNTQLTTSVTEPAAGWSVKPADATGFVILTSGSVQLNQTNSGLGYKVYNWGGGTNITDTGCKYSVNVASDLEPYNSIATAEAEAITVSGGEGVITISGTDGEALVYDARGALVATGHGKVAAHPGVLIVAVAGRTFKAVVK